MKKEISRTNRDAPTGHKLFNFTSTSLQSRRWAHIKRSAKMKMSSFWISFVLGMTVLLLCLWIVTCGPIPVKKSYLHTHVEVEEVRVGDSTVGIKTSLGYFISDLNQAEFNHGRHPPYWGDTSTSAYTFKHVDKYRYDSLDDTIKYFDKESSDLVFDVSHIDSRVRKPEGDNVKSACNIVSVKVRNTSKPALWPMERSGIGQSAGRRRPPRPETGLVGARPQLDNGGVKI